MLIFIKDIPRGDTISSFVADTVGTVRMSITFFSPNAFSGPPKILPPN